MFPYINANTKLISPRIVTHVGGYTNTLSSLQDCPQRKKQMQRPWWPLKNFQGSIHGATYMFLKGPEHVMDMTLGVKPGLNITNLTFK